MFPVGETSTAICAAAAAYATMATGVPSGSVLFPATAIWNAVSAIVVARTPKATASTRCACCAPDPHPHQLAEPPPPHHCLQLRLSNSRRRDRAPCAGRRDKHRPVWVSFGAGGDVAREVHIQLQPTPPAT